MKILNIIILFILLIHGISGEAQQSHVIPYELRVSRIAKGLGVSEERAKEVIMALDYNGKRIEKVIQNKKIDPVAKQRILASLIDERRQKINEMLTKDQILELKQLFAPQIQKEQNDRQNISAFDRQRRESRNVSGGSVKVGRQMIIRKTNQKAI